MTDTTNWFIDIEEKWSDGSFQTKSLGPLEFSTETGFITMWDFVSAVRDQIDSLNTERLADHPPPLTPPEYDFWAKLYLPTGEDLTRLNNFMIKYVLSQTVTNPTFSGNRTLEGFRIAFKEGPHGWQVPTHGWAGETPRGEFKFENHTDTQAAVVPYSSHIVSIQDRPPIAPDVTIVPYSGVSNKVLLLLNSSTGEFTTSPVIIKPSDAEQIANQYTAQTNIAITPEEAATQVAEGTLKLEYRNDDPISKYEIFRTTTRPTSYASFNTSLNPHKIVTGKVRLGKESSASHLIDDIRPNTKYYYCFRALDVHNNFSNPSHVYEVELVDNQGQIYMILNTFMFKTEVENKAFKSGRRYVYIEPSLRNVAYDASIDSSETAASIPGGGNPILGPATDNCWEKTFKVRLTSKKTGKKVDLNILCKNSGVENP
tara:strand:- start:3895 stop:5178 length:1284 start_codon:yes stop_codon:yes gene_type:complete